MNIKAQAIRCWMVALVSVSCLAAGPGDLRLVEAVKNLDKDAVRSLLQQHVDVNAPQGNGATALSWAVNWSDVETVDLLIRAGAKVNAADDLGVTPLWLACSNGNATVAGKLLQARANAKAALATGETVLMACSRTGTVEAVKALLARGADVNAKETQRGQTALMWAAAEKRPEITRLLIERGGDVQARSKSGFSALLFAARSGDLESARMLLAAGAKVNESDSDGMTPLLIASASGHEETAIFLLDKGADPNTADRSGIASIHYALQQGISLLRQHGGISSEESYYGYFHRPNMRQLVAALLKHGANPNARIATDLVWAGYLAFSSDHTLLGGSTPFLLAAASGDTGIMRMLVAAGADPRLTPPNHTTALMIAAAKGAVGSGSANDDYNIRNEEMDRNALEAVKLALDLGIDINATDDLGQTALHYAAYWGVEPIIQFLVDKGAKVDAQDQFGMTPLSISEGISPPNFATSINRIKRPRRVHKNAAALLRKLGASVTITAAGATGR